MSGNGKEGCGREFEARRSEGCALTCCLDRAAVHLAPRRQPVPSAVGQRNGQGIGADTVKFLTLDEAGRIKNSKSRGDLRFLLEIPRRQAKRKVLMETDTTRLGLWLVVRGSLIGSASQDGAEFVTSLGGRQALPVGRDCVSAGPTLRSSPRNEKDPRERVFQVVREGIEPPTRGFSIPCSTN